MKVSDEEFFKWLHAQEKEQWFVDLLNEGHHRSAEIHAEAVAGGLEMSGEDFKNYSAPSAYIEGGLVDVLRNEALHILGDQAQYVDKTRVFLLPTTSLNGFASLTPLGTPFVVLNHGVIVFLSYLSIWYSAFYTWNSNEPYCLDHSQEAFAKAILRLAHFASTGQQKYMVGLKPLICPSVSMWKDSTYVFAHLIELMIILHEFGHVICGHLNSSVKFRVQIAGGVDLDGLKLSRDQEFEADEFAFNCLCRSSINTQMRPRDFAYAFGLLFKFFELCHRLYPPAEPEAEWTHPHPEERWKRIKALAKVADYPNTLAFNLDNAFDCIFRGAGLKV